MSYLYQSALLLTNTINACKDFSCFDVPSILERYSTQSSGLYNFHYLEHTLSSYIQLKFTLTDLLRSLVANTPDRSSFRIRTDPSRMVTDGPYS